MAAGILDSFMRGYNFGDSVQQRQVDRKFQEEVRGRQRLEWDRNDQALAVDELQREWQAKLGNQTLEEAAANPGNQGWLTDLTDRTAKALGVDKRKMGNATITSVVPTGNGRVSAMMDVKDDQGNPVSSGPPTVNQTSDDNDPLVDWNRDDIFAALRAKSKEFHAAMQASETSAQASQAMTDYLSEQGATYQAPSTQYEAQSTQNQGLRSAINGQPRTGMANEKFALSTVGSETVPASPYATGAQQTPIDGMDPAEQAKLNAYLDASVEKGRAAAQTPPQPPAKTLADAQKEKDAQSKGLVEVVADTFSKEARDNRVATEAKGRVARALDINDPAGAQIRRRPQDFQRDYAASRDQFSPAEQQQLDLLFNPAGQGVETPNSGRIQRSAKSGSAASEVPSTKSSAPAKSDPQVDQLTDAKAKQVAASVRPPQNEKQLEGMQKQIENIRSSGQVTAKQKRALGQLFRLNKITAEQYERAMTTGRLSKRELDQIKTDSRIYVWDKETGEVVSSVENLPQAATAADVTKAAGAGLKLTTDSASFLNSQFERLAYGAGAKDSTQAKQFAGRAMERVTGTPGLVALGIDVTNPTHQNYLWEANRLAQIDEANGRPGWFASLFGAKGDRVNDLTPYVLDQMFPNKEIVKVSQSLAAHYDRETTTAILLQATKIAQAENKTVSQVLQEMNQNAQ